MIARSVGRSVGRSIGAGGFAVAGGGGYDTDAQAYITAVEAADSESLETGVKDAINAFVVGCKSDGIWGAIKAACILAGARTLDGALVPLVGTAPTNNNFVSGDYSRTAGLTGNGSTKYLDSNRNCNVDPQNSSHQSVFVITAPTSSSARAYIGAGGGATGTSQMNSSEILPYPINYFVRNGTPTITASTISTTGFIGQSRSLAASYIVRAESINTTQTQTSQTPYDGNLLVFARNSATNVAGLFNDATLAFYSIGESLDLALLDTRVTNLINAIGAAIP